MLVCEVSRLCGNTKEVVPYFNPRFKSLCASVRVYPLNACRDALIWVTERKSPLRSSNIFNPTWRRSGNFHVLGRGLVDNETLYHAFGLLRRRVNILGMQRVWEVSREIGKICVWIRELERVGRLEEGLLGKKGGQRLNVSTVGSEEKTLSFVPSRLPHLSSSPKNNLSFRVEKSGRVLHVARSLRCPLRLASVATTPTALRETKRWAIPKPERIRWDMIVDYKEKRRYETERNIH